MSTGQTDDPRARLDPGGMLACVQASPDQWREALDVAEGATAGLIPSEADVVLVCGMGGSGFAGDVAALLAERTGRVPVVPVKGYTLPAWASTRTPVVAVSYSGGTEEVAACVDAAEDRAIPWSVITSGGALASRAEAVGRPAVLVPAGFQPRAALAHLTVPLLVALADAGHLAPVAADLAAVPGHLATTLAGWTDGAADSAPGGVAARLVDADPVVLYGGGGPGALVATRGKTQINENAKRPATVGVLPELDHNEVVGWETRDRHDRPGLLVVRDPEDHPQVRRRIDATLAVTDGRFLDVVGHDLAGPSLLARVAAGALFVDLVSVELALLGGVDPTPVAVIDELKRRIL